MALDVYVMPLWRFKADDFRSPVEAATGLPAKIVAEGRVESRTRVGWFGRWRARREVSTIRHAVEAANHAPARWKDEGEVVYSAQSPGFEALRAYARWLDCRDRIPEFEAPPEGNYHKHPVLTTPVRRLSCPQLVEHSCYSGYFLPCDFERMVQVERYLLFGRWPMLRSVGSAPRLLKELEVVRAELEKSRDRASAEVTAAYRQLREVAEQSCRHTLPIIFWG